MYINIDARVANRNHWQPIYVYIYIQIEKFYLAVLKLTFSADRKGLQLKCHVGEYYTNKIQPIFKS